VKVLRRVLAIAGGVVLLIVCTVFGWLYLYTADLPPITDLYQYDLQHPLRFMLVPIQ